MASHLNCNCAACSMSHLVTSSNVFIKSAKEDPRLGEKEALEVTTRESLYVEALRHDQATGESLAGCYPPGPEDDPEDYETFLLAAKVGLMVPTDEVRDGHRIWQEAPHLYSLREYPPGPRDDVLTYGIQFMGVDRGFFRPTNRLRNGQRAFVVESKTRRLH